MLAAIQKYVVPTISVLLCVFTLTEANLSKLEGTSALAVFVMLGLVLCFLIHPASNKLKDNKPLRYVDLLLAVSTVLCCGYVIVQTESVFENSLWLGSTSLGNRAGDLLPTDYAIGLVGILLVLESTRRSIGLAVPLLAVAAIFYAFYRDQVPEWMFSFKSLSTEDIIASCFLKGQGVFGKAASVMFRYVFLFVIFGAFLEVTGATQFIIDISQRLFGNSPGGPAKVSVLGSGLMGSLSGSAVANAVTTGAFTIPMMRKAGFKPHIAGGITAAAAAGGALVPPVMGAGAYMMIEFMDEKVEFLDIARAAIIPAALYYLSIFLIVHFYARKMGARPEEEPQEGTVLQTLFSFGGMVFLGALSVLLVFLALGKTPTLSVTISLGVILALWLIHPRKQFSFQVLLEALVKSAKNGISLVAASACVGIVIGIVDATRVADAFGAEIKSVVETSLFLALLGVMSCSLFLGMGVPSVVCYLLMATMMGSLLTQLQVPELAAHLFIFYFGMMSMVTPPVALAAYASASIANAKIMPTALAAFRFSLVGFTLPFMFIYRPALLLMGTDGAPPTALDVVVAITAAIFGIVALAASITGFLRGNLSPIVRAILLAAAALLLAPDLGGREIGIGINLAGGLILVGIYLFSRAQPTEDAAPVAEENA